MRPICTPPNRELGAPKASAAGAASMVLPNCRRDCIIDSRRCGRSNLWHSSPRFASRIILQLALVVEDHGLDLIGSQCCPMGNSGVVRVAFSREIDPALGH